MLACELIHVSPASDVGVLASATKREKENINFRVSFCYEKKKFHIRFRREVCCYRIEFLAMKRTRRLINNPVGRKKKIWLSKWSQFPLVNRNTSISRPTLFTTKILIKTWQGLILDGCETRWGKQWIFYMQWSHNHIHREKNKRGVWLILDKGGMECPLLYW